MTQKWLLTTGTALALAAALAGCGNTPAADQPQSSQPASLISMEQAQTAALDAADIDAADAEVSSATLDEVAGVTCYKVEFTSGDHTYAYSINAESGEVLEASYRLSLIHIFAGLKRVSLLHFILYGDLRFLSTVNLTLTPLISFVELKLHHILCALLRR